MRGQIRPVFDPVVIMIILLLGAAAASAQEVELLGAEVWSHTLMRIDRDTATWTPVGHFEVCTLAGLAYDPNHDILYGVAPCTDNIYIIDRATGAATCVGRPGALGVGNANGLAYDPVHDILYATDNDTNSLLTVDPATGRGTILAGISGGFTEIEGLGFDAAGQVLYGLTQLQGRIVRIDVQTGQAVAVSGPLPAQTWRGLDFDAERRLLYASAVNIFGDAPLYSFDPVTGSLDFIGTMAGAEAVQGLGFVREAPAAGLTDGDPPSAPGAPRLACATRPNPAVEQAEILLYLPEPGRVSLLILDAAGRRVRRLAENLARPAGEARFAWDGRGDAGQRLAAGVYFCRLTVDGATITRRLQRAG